MTAVREGKGLQNIPMAYIADVVGITLCLKELRHIRRQRVLLMNLLQTPLVEELQGNRAMRSDVTCDTSKTRKDFFFTELTIIVAVDSHHSSEAG